MGAGNLSVLSASKNHQMKSGGFFGNCLFGFLDFRDHAHVHAGLELAGEGADLLLGELDRTIDEREECIIFTSFDVLGRVILGTALADDDIADLDFLVAVDLDSESFGNGIATEVGRSTGFSMRHRKKIVMMESSP